MPPGSADRGTEGPPRLSDYSGARRWVVIGTLIPVPRSSGARMLPHRKDTYYVTRTAPLERIFVALRTVLVYSIRMVFHKYNDGRKAELSGIL